MKKCAVINDLSGFGKCSLGVSIPIISVMGAEVHPLVTAVLSNQTSYDSYKSFSLTDTMNPFFNEWKKRCDRFDAVLTGYFADEKQIENAVCFIDDFCDSDSIVIVDPVMADNGEVYSGYTDNMCCLIKKLCFKADIITPNTTELAILAGEKPSDNYDDIIRYANKLINNGIKKIIVTGYENDGMIANLIFENGEVQIVSAKNIGGYFSGTGDIFSSVIIGSILRGCTLYDSVCLAAKFIEESIKNTDVLNHNDGIQFEKCLKLLID